MLRLTLAVVLALPNLIAAFVHPITIQGHYFVDSVSREPFYIKGVDYQPGGSSGVTSSQDPLSNPDTCTRDIILFQELGINTIRIYSINSDLNHDVCMSLLASAGIYLVLDVNSPLPDHHLNRYEPWTTYNVDYLENVFKVVEQFSYYNNTLGFFAGNEIINDDISAKKSPVYVKALIRDIKQYIEYNCPRFIPVGYSAADDLKYRMPFAEYLECVDESPSDSVDFYGVNTYQWCGEQTFYTSGYNILVEDYSNYARPIFFSEFGCNEITPRIFEEVNSLYSNDMVDVFSGGLVYEFTQEPNNYGLIDVLSTGDVQLRKDFLSLKTQYESLPKINLNHIASSMKKNAKDIQGRINKQSYGLPDCDAGTFSNIDVSAGVPKSIAEDLIELGVQVDRGHYVELTDEQLFLKYKILSPNGGNYQVSDTLEKVIDVMTGTEIRRIHRGRGSRNCMYNYDCSSDEGNDDDSDNSSYDDSTEDSDDEDEMNKQDYFNIFAKVSKFFRHMLKLVSAKILDEESN